MSARKSDAGQVVEGRFATRVTVQHDVWYSARLVELMAEGEPGPRGGRPKAIQILLTLPQARELAAVLSTVIADAEEAER